MSLLSFWMYDSHNLIERMNKKGFSSHHLLIQVYMQPHSCTQPLWADFRFSCLCGLAKIFSFCVSSRKRVDWGWYVLSVSLFHSVSVSLFSWLIRTTSIHFKAHRVVQLFRAIMTLALLTLPLFRSSCPLFPLSFTVFFMKTQTYCFIQSRLDILSVCQ